MKKGKLLLLPNLLDKEGDHHLFFPQSVDEAVASLEGLIVESEKEGRAFLKRFHLGEGKSFRDIPLKVFNEHEKDVEALLIPLKEGQVWGLISDIGMPILADPGYELVRRAYDFGIIVKAFIGPSSIIQALLLSGLSAQRFAFHGYLPKEGKKALELLEKRSKEEKSTQLFIEAPYRNMKMLTLLLETLSEDTTLCVAWDLTLKTESVITFPIKVWKKRSLPNIDKRPALFLFSA